MKRQFLFGKRRIGGAALFKRVRAVYANRGFVTSAARALQRYSRKLASGRLRFNGRGHGAGHHRDRVRHRHRLRVHDRQTAAQAVNVNTVCDFEHVGHVVRDEDDRQPTLLHIKNEFEHAARFLDPERGGRLVHDDDALGEGRGARHSNPLTLAAGQGFDGLMDILDRHKAEIVQFLPREFRHASAIGRSEPLSHDPWRPRLAAEEHVVGDRQRRRESQSLIHGLDARFARGDRRGEVNDFSTKPNLAGVGNDRAAKSLDQRRLARAIVPNDGEDLAWKEVEVGVVERGDPPVTLDEAARPEDRFDAHFDTLRIHWSRATATMIRTPIANSCQSTSSPARDTAERKTPTISAPTSVPMIDPLPPNSDVPPITTAVMLSRLAFSPAVGLMAPTRPISAQPAIAAMRPANT